MAKKIIFYELNEVPKKVFDFYANSHPHSAFAKLQNHSEKYLTKTADFGHLSPWITWPSLHRGVPNTKHQISDLGQNITHVNKQYAPIWDILSRNNVNVGVFGSMHSYPLADNIEDYAFFVPDTFAAGPECFPKKLESFQSFNLDMVAANGRNVDKSLKLKSAANFLKSCPSLGLQFRTAASIGSQLCSEIIDKKKVVRRRTSQIQLAFDFYLKALKDSRPDISFFFTNHLASSMHRYWPALFPEDYDELKFDKQWISDWKNEIPFALSEANHQLNQLIKFVDNNEDYQLIVASSMGQAAVQEAELLTSQILITNINKLMDFLGLDDGEWEPHLAMQPRQVLTVKSAEAEKKLLKLKNLRLNGKEMLVNALGNNDYSLKIEMMNETELSITLDGQPISSENTGIELVDLQDAAGSNAYHIPEGILISYSKDQLSKTSNKADWLEISAMEVAPSLLKHFNVEKPSYMESPFNL